MRRPFRLRHTLVRLKPRSYCMLPIKFQPTVPGTSCDTLHVSARVSVPTGRTPVASGRHRGVTHGKAQQGASAVGGGNGDGDGDNPAADAALHASLGSADKVWRVAGGEGSGGPSRHRGGTNSRGQAGPHGSRGGKKPRPSSTRRVRMATVLTASLELTASSHSATKR